MARPGLFLCTTLDRIDAGGDTVTCDVIVFFGIAGVTPGRRRTWSDPGWGTEYEFDFVSAQFDPEPDDAPGPPTAIEMATLRTWFDAHHFDATDCANDNTDFGDAA